jgi:hypothetical protein
VSETVYLLTICLPLGTILLVFGLKYFSAAFQARSRLASESAYRELAEKAVTVQSDNAASLSSIQAELSQIRIRLAAVEKILKEVE